MWICCDAVISGTPLAPIRFPIDTDSISGRRESARPVEENPVLNPPLTPHASALITRLSVVTRRVVAL
jgi:hypothetical protein